MQDHLHNEFEKPCTNPSPRPPTPKMPPPSNMSGHRAVATRLAHRLATAVATAVVSTAIHSSYSCSRLAHRLATWHTDWEQRRSYNYGCIRG